MCDEPLTNPRSGGGLASRSLDSGFKPTERVFPRADGACPPAGAALGPRVLAAIPTLSRHR